MLTPILKYKHREKAYRGHFHPVVQAFAVRKINEIKKYIDFSQIISILDVGCGKGIFTYYLSNLAHTIGLDISNSMLKENPCSLLVQGDVQHLPFKDCQFDLVFSANLLHHVKDPLNTLKEMKRVSRKYIVLIEPNMFNPLMFLYCLLTPWERGALKFTPSYVSSLVSRTDLNIIEQFCMGMIFQNKTPKFLLPFF